MASNASAFVECNQGQNLPLSDNNVSTTQKGEAMRRTGVNNVSGAINWEMNEPEDINVSSSNFSSLKILSISLFSLCILYYISHNNSMLFYY